VLCRHWNTWDSSSGEQHYYRAAQYPWVVQQALDAGLSEAQGWSVNNTVAQILLPVDLDFTVGTDGWTIPHYWPADGADCKKYDPHQLAGSLQVVQSGDGVRDPEIVGTEEVDGQELPVIMARSIQL
jgi:hypothetical protein